MRLGLGAILLVVASAELRAEVRVVKSSDGTHVMYNVGRSVPKPAPRRSMPRITAMELDELIARYARRSRLDTDLVKAVVQAESAFDPRAVSRKGAMGLMQLMPSTAAELSVRDPFDAEENLHAGTRYLRQMLDLFSGKLELALAAYNSGPEAVRRYDGVPPYRETVDYVEKVMRAYRNDPTYDLRGATGIGRGRRTYLSRGIDGVLLLTTTPPSR